MLGKELNTVLSGCKFKPSMEPTEAAQKAVKRIVDNIKQEVIKPVELIRVPKEDCFNKGYMQTEAFWNDPHNKKALELGERAAEETLAGKDYLAKSDAFRIKYLSERNGTSNKINLMKKIRSLQGE